MRHRGKSLHLGLALLSPFMKEGKSVLDPQVTLSPICKKERPGAWLPTLAPWCTVVLRVPGLMGIIIHLLELSALSYSMPVTLLKIGSLAHSSLVCPFI